MVIALRFTTQNANASADETVGVENPDEIAIGSSTLRRLGKHIGDSVTITGNTLTHTLRIVGEVTLPTLGIVHGEHASLGVGAMVDYHLIPGFDRNRDPIGFVGPNVLLVRFAFGTDLRQGRARMQKAADAFGQYPGEVHVSGPLRPAEIVNSTDIGGSPQILAGLLGAAALLTLGLGLGTSVRRRRRDLAILKALGFTRSQVAAAVRWQATTTIAVGLVIGVPVGVALGRTLWVLFARQLAVLPEASTPVVLIASIAAVAVVLGNVVAAVPGGVARSVRPSLVLRSE